MLDKNKIRIGIHPMSWTNDDLTELGKDNTFKQCVSEIALAGYAGSVVGSKFPMDTEVLKKELNLRGLSITGWWFSSFLTTKPYEEVAEAFTKHVQFLNKMGQMDTPIFTNKPVFTDEEWDKLVTGLHKLADIAAEYDTKIAFHHHMGTGVQTTAEIDRLMEATDPNKVFLLFDSGHLTFSGEDAVAVLKKYVNRVAHVHLKDVHKDIVAQCKAENWSFLKAILNGCFEIPGDGDVDFDSIFEILGESNYEGWFVVESDVDPNKKDALEYAIKSRKFIREKTGL